MAKQLLMVVVAATVLVAGFLFLRLPMEEAGGLNTDDPGFVRLGHQIYQAQCADSCHGFKLEGQPDWRSPLPEGGLPAPPHDETGHTWHHDDQLLFDYTKKGGAAIAPEGFKSRMPSFAKILSDEEIWAVLSYIKSTWPTDVQRQQERRNPKP